MPKQQQSEAQERLTHRGGSLADWSGMGSDQQRLNPPHDVVDFAHNQPPAQDCLEMQ